MILRFPWPPKELSPNARVHWVKKHNHSKKYRVDCAYTMMAAKFPREIDSDRAVLVITFRPPSKRRADLDNMLASFKRGIDCISEYIGIDDSNFQLVITKGEPVKGGAVEVEIQAIRPVRVAA